MINKNSFCETCHVDFSNCDTCISKTKNYKFNIECIETSWGWGNKGQKGYIVVAAWNIHDAEIKVKKQIPGNWIYSFKEMTEMNPCFNPTVVYSYEVIKEE